jgi:hypothetical protein
MSPLGIGWPRLALWLGPLLLAVAVGALLGGSRNVAAIAAVVGAGVLADALLIRRARARGDPDAGPRE